MSENTFDPGPWGPKGCDWAGGLCSDGPTHQVISISHGQRNLSVYCQRHYTLTLNHMLEVHLADCPNPAVAHAADFGPIEGRDSDSLYDDLGALTALYLHEDTPDSYVLEQFKHVLDNWRSSLEPDDQELIEAVAMYGAWKLEAGETRDYFPHLFEVHRKRKNSLGEDAPRTLEALGNLAAAVVREGRAESAVPYYEQLYEGRKKTLGAGHPDTLHAQKWHATLLRLTDGIPAAIEALETYIADQTATSGKQHPMVTQAETALLDFLQQEGELERAKEIIEARVGSLEVALGTDSPVTQTWQKRLRTLEKQINEGARA